MHIAVSIAAVLLTWRYSDWKNWRNYHPTLLYIALSNLLYNFIYCKHLLWEYKPNHIIAELLSTFVILPLAGLLLLSGYPTAFKDRALRTIKFVAVFFGIEVIYNLLGILVYDNGWNIWLSLLWDCIMIIAWALHHKRPMLTYGLSVLFITIMLLVFPVKLG